MQNRGGWTHRRARSNRRAPAFRRPAWWPRPNGWQAHRGGLDFASFVDPIWLTPATLESMDYDRDNGLRVGLGYRFDSGWDVGWNYTYFRTRAAGAVDQAANPGLVLIATRSYFDLAVDSVYPLPSKQTEISPPVRPARKAAYGRQKHGR